MIERQRSTGFYSSDDEAATHIPDHRQLQQFSRKERLIGTQVRHNDFKKEIRLARYQVAGDDLGHVAERLLDGDGVLVPVTINLDTHHHRQAQAEFFLSKSAR